MKNKPIPAKVDQAWYTTAPASHAVIHSPMQCTGCDTVTIAETAAMLHTGVIMNKSKSTYRFPEFMRQQRSARQWTFAQAARALHHSPTWVKNCEDGNIVQPKPETLREIALGYSVPLADVLESLGLPPVEDPEADAMRTTLDDLASILRETRQDRWSLVVEAARLIERVPSR